MCAAYVHISKLVIIAIYLPPNLAKEITSSIFYYLVSVIDNALNRYPYYKCMVMGDLNRHDTDVFTKELSLVNIVNSSTRGTAILDYVFISDTISDFYENSDVGNPIGRSDHNTVTCNPKPTRSQNITFKTTRDFSNKNIEIIKEKLARVNWSALLRMTDLDNKVNLFYKTMNEAMSHVPIIKVYLKEKDKPWMTPIIKTKILTRWRAYKKKDFDLYSKLKLEIKEEIQKAKRNWAQRAKSKSHNIWGVINELKGNKNNLPFSEENLPLHDYFCEKFTSVFSQPSSYELSTSQPALPSSEFLTDPQITHKMLTTLNTKKTIGPDDIPNVIYKKTADFISDALCNIFNHALSTRCYPEIWKKSWIIPIPKTTPPNKEEVRPISLLSTPGKLLEKLIIKPIKRTLEDNFGHSQYGYKSSTSTTSALIAIQESIVNAFEDTNTRNVLLITFDFSKAFDRVNHDILLSKISFLPQNSFEIIKSYLHGRTFRTKIGNKISSKSCNVVSSVPQGSLLGPLLWCIYCKDLVIYENNTITIKFADDTTILIIIKKYDSNPQELVRLVIGKVQEWSNGNMMTLNNNKTKVLNISFSINPWQPDTDLKSEIQFVESLKLLGVTFTSSLSWNLHIQNITKVCSQRLAALRILKGYLEPGELKMTYNAMIQSVYEYASPLFISMPTVLKEKIKKIFRRAHRIMCPNCVCQINTDDRRLLQARSLFQAIHNNTKHNLHNLLPTYNASNDRFILPNIRTDRKLKSFMIHNALSYNNRA